MSLFITVLYKRFKAENSTYSLFLFLKNRIFPLIFCFKVKENML
ncbi:hypothetical protein HMPREF0083_01906 [Aneurinibacillus aneurinilyticus ATCC 12856]|uniref:Uncharacterized protein n=1 Tax=Aneurinibacillus aneurinilyticus ATCC 12856 TaxID=649747 RepID=U1YD01_ANEAE|nr:hypothetical protein HMPREF0083_01906 [Aneurinibacillus aneurinilyticus ATCC 12856]